jgi:hypothetical protein
MVRPLVCAVGEFGDVDCELARIATIDEFYIRQTAFQTRLDTMAGTSSDPSSDLAYLQAMIRAARRYSVPALSLDVLRAVARHPVAPLLLLFNADDASKQDVIELEDELPFLWCLADPAALLRLTSDLIRVLRDIGLDEVQAREAAAAKLADLGEACPQLSAACWLAREGNGLPHAQNQPSLEQLRQTEIRNVLRAGCGARRTSDEEWRYKLADTRDWQNLDPELLADAPLFAAGLVVARTPAEPLEMTALRHCRELDPDSFDSRFCHALLLAISASAQLS